MLDRLDQCGQDTVCLTEVGDDGAVAAAQAAVADGPDVGLVQRKGVRGVTHIDQGGHAGADVFQAAGEREEVHLVGLDVDRGGRGYRCTQSCTGMSSPTLDADLEEVRVGVDEAREDGGAGHVDGLAGLIGASQVGGCPDGRDAVAADRHRTVLDHAPLVILGYNRAVDQQQICAGHASPAVAYTPAIISPIFCMLARSPDTSPTMWPS